MKAKVSWVEGMKFVGESESGHKVILDGANPGEGGQPDGDDPAGGRWLQLH